MAGPDLNALPTRRRILWVAWERHRRTLELCRYLGIDPVVFAPNSPRLLNLPWVLLKTLLTILSTKPATLIVQNPSVFLALFACALKQFFGYRLVVDTHNAGMIPEHFLLKRLPALYWSIQKAADVSVVTNPKLADIVAANGGRPLVLPDRLPEPTDLQTIDLVGLFNVTFICGFGADEPLSEILGLPKRLGEDVALYVTGDCRRLGDRKAALEHEHLIFTGYLPDADYWNLIYSSDLIVDLTTRENCLVCGAYEAVAVGTPLVLSDTRTLRSYFHRGAVFTDNSRQNLDDSVQYALEHLVELRAEVAALRDDIARDWEHAGIRFRQLCLKGRTGPAADQKRVEGQPGNTDAGSPVDWSLDIRKPFGRRRRHVQLHID